MDNPFKVRPQVYAIYMVGSASSVMMYLLAEEYHALVWCAMFWVMCYVCVRVSKDALIQRLKSQMLADDLAALGKSLGETLEDIDKAKQSSHLDK